VIEIKELTKIFGPEPGRALALLDAGYDKERLLKETGHAVGVHDVSLTIRRGEIFVIMGLSGSGKSTLLRCVNRLIEPTRGQVWLDGAEVTAMDRRPCGNCGAAAWAWSSSASRCCPTARCWTTSPSAWKSAA